MPLKQRVKVIREKAIRTKSKILNKRLKSKLRKNAKRKALRKSNPKANFSPFRGL